jgi:hypothetical protein
MYFKLFTYIVVPIFLVSFIKSTHYATNMSQETDEYAVKAAFVYNFTKYIDWEDEKLYNASHFKIAVYKDSPIEEPLKDLLENKKIKNKKVEIVRFSDKENFEKVHIVFIPSQINTKDFKEIMGIEKIKHSLIRV